MSAARAGTFPVTHSNAEWHKRLSDDQFAVLRQDGTERPFTSKLLEEHRTGTFTCAGCDHPLFPSATKFDSGTGWPSFFVPLAKTSVAERRDGSLGMERIEIHCARCGGHLGHVFDDGPVAAGGQRYCMNSLALNFQPTGDDAA